MPKKIRVIIAALFFVLITLLFLDFTGTLHKWFGWLARIQLIPAILAVNAIAVVSLVLLTLIFGRIYCSVICPLGIFQDGISNISARRKKKKSRFWYSPAKSWLRYGVLILFVISMVAGANAIASLLDPYAAYGRIASNFFAPLYYWCNNILAYFAERVDSYTFYSVDVWIKSGITFGITAATLIIIAILAWRNGRTYCNTICPVGTLLGLLSKFSLFRPTINTEKCNSCGLCARNCKASCIDTKAKNIDYSRCVTCFNCTEKCKTGAIKYTIRKKEKKKEPEINLPTTPTTPSNGGVSRRGALSLIAAFAVTNAIKAQEIRVDGGVADIEDKKVPKRKTPVVPPGALGIKHMKIHCTSCQLCVSACPNNILRPSSKLETLMQPEMSFERGYCRPECTKCSQVCPTGAIKSITTADKSAISIGTAVWIKDNCVVNTDEVQCNNCEYHCPTGAITLISKDPGSNNSLKIPVVDNSLCIGCGACEYLCPARPFSAIYVEGNIRHHSI
ncbi:4Fe-4S dicluster domain-containing protein [Dysgonomonas sp. 216]|uniref:4Fe-4S binding protein n=1 Tax=Dysgonomonas sp. 216 TaxID=2302934 RepID=UPI0013D2F0CE|nr:4Fe-4S binding protein [Dysgonomonas sp. 216]NDW18824.1 4Fe-4S dicluster domain-containing protein [Dysgonomonas sp. 216]